VNFQPIHNYGVIGNMRSAALVSTAGSIDFFCFPEFDSPSVFAALLDTAKGGAFTICPEREGYNAKQMYIPETNVLLTRFLSDDGIVELTDFMPVDETRQRHCVMRRVTVVKGDAGIKVRCCPRFNYARSGHRAEKLRGGIVFTEEGSENRPVSLQASVGMEVEGGDACASFVLKTGESACFVFGFDSADTAAEGLGELLERGFQSTSAYWRHWAGKSRYSGRWREMVNRSALVLKLTNTGR
jgi:GH15 family glucan-1,4-alpha-glucosidase